MKIEFLKYQGNGNDFIILDNRINQIKLNRSQVSFLCDRHFGIGADGLMLLETLEGFDFSLKYFNSDGNESTMCGNGGRCMTVFAHELGIFRKKARFSAIDGPHESEILSKHDNYSMVRLKMKDTRPLQKFEDGYLIDTGSPHFVKFVTEVAALDVLSEGRKLRNDSRFAPFGCNVDFVELTSKGITVRTYERGVENETLSCGTGVTAAALITAFLDKDNTGSFAVSTIGGDFMVYFNQTESDFSEVYLEGPAGFVFNGELTI